MPRPKEPDGLSAVADALRVHESSVRRMIARGELAPTQERDGAPLRFDMAEVRALARKHKPRGPGRPRARAEDDEGATFLRVTAREVAAWDLAARFAQMTRTAWLVMVADRSVFAYERGAQPFPAATLAAPAGTRPVNLRHSARSARAWDRVARLEETTRARWLRAVANRAVDGGQP